MNDLEIIKIKLDFLGQKIDTLNFEKTRVLDIHLKIKNILDLLEENRIIDAIKEYRLLTGVSLKESKDFIEDLNNRLSKKFDPRYDHG